MKRGVVRCRGQEERKGDPVGGGQCREGGLWIVQVGDIDLCAAATYNSAMVGGGGEEERELHFFLKLRFCYLRNEVQINFMILIPFIPTIIKS